MNDNQSNYECACAAIDDCYKYQFEEVEKIADPKDKVDAIEAVRMLRKLAAWLERDTSLMMEEKPDYLSDSIDSIPL